MEWAIRHVHWARDWKKVVFTDEQKNNMDDTAGAKYRWQDRDPPLQTYLKRPVVKDD